MFYAGQPVPMFTLIEALSRRYVDAINATTQWSGVETWATPASLWAIDSNDGSDRYEWFFVAFRSAIFSVSAHSAPERP